MGGEERRSGHRALRSCFSMEAAGQGNPVDKGSVDYDREKGHCLATRGYHHLSYAYRNHSPMT
jgi:hypothetical protein